MSLLDEQHIYSRLRSTSPLPAGGRVYPSVLPQNATYPAITYMRVSTSYLNALTGTPNLENPVFQVDCWATTHTEAWTVAAAAKSAMLSATTPFKAQVIGAQQLSETEANRDLFRVSMDFLCWFNEG